MTWIRKPLIIVVWLLVAASLSYLAQAMLALMGISHEGLISFATQAPFTFVAVAPLVWIWWRAWRLFTR